MFPVAYLVIMRRYLVQSMYDTYAPLPMTPPNIDITVPDLRNAAIACHHAIVASCRLSKAHQPLGPHEARPSWDIDICSTVHTYHSVMYCRTTENHLIDCFWRIILHTFGIGDTAVYWFKSYASSRKQFVRRVPNKLSVTYLDCGVPQGSVLGPILFVLYTINLKTWYIICTVDLRHF